MGFSINVGFVGLLTIVFVILRLIGFTDWEWYWVLSPLWIFFIVWVAVVLFVLAVMSSTFSPRR